MRPHEFAVLDQTLETLLCISQYEMLGEHAQLPTVSSDNASTTRFLEKAKLA
jgi:hypothetical protein